MLAGLSHMRLAPPTDSTNQPLVPITLHVDVTTMTLDERRG